MLSSPLHGLPRLYSFPSSSPRLSNTPLTPVMVNFRKQQFFSPDKSTDCLEFNRTVREHHSNGHVRTIYPTLEELDNTVKEENGDWIPPVLQENDWEDLSWSPLIEVNKGLTALQQWEVEMDENPEDYQGFIGVEEGDLRPPLDADAEAVEVVDSHVEFHSATEPEPGQILDRAEWSDLDTPAPQTQRKRRPYVPLPNHILRSLREPTPDYPALIFHLSRHVPIDNRNTTETTNFLLSLLRTGHRAQAILSKLITFCEILRQLSRKKKIIIEMYKDNGEGHQQNVDRIFMRMDELRKEWRDIVVRGGTVFEGAGHGWVVVKECFELALKQAPRRGEGGVGTKNKRFREWMQSSQI